MSKLQPNNIAKMKQQMKKPVVRLPRSMIVTTRAQEANTSGEVVCFRTPANERFYYREYGYISHLRFILNK